MDTPFKPIVTIFKQSTVVLIILVIIINVFVPIVMNLANVGLHVYINYLLWFNLLTLFYLLLPARI